MNNVDAQKAAALKQLQDMKDDIPKRKKEVNDVLRMIDLAKQSPRAALNQDFIDRVEQVWMFRKIDTERTEKMILELEKVMGMGPIPEPPTPTPPNPKSIA